MRKFVVIAFVATMFGLAFLMAMCEYPEEVLNNGKVVQIEPVYSYQVGPDRCVTKPYVGKLPEGREPPNCFGRTGYDWHCCPCDYRITSDGCRNVKTNELWVKMITKSDVWNGYNPGPYSTVGFE